MDVKMDIRISMTADLCLKSRARLPKHLLIKSVKPKWLKKYEKIFKYLKSKMGHLKYFLTRKYSQWRLFWSTERNCTSQNQQFWRYLQDQASCLGHGLDYCGFKQWKICPFIYLQTWWILIYTISSAMIILLIF